MGGLDAVPILFLLVCLTLSEDDRHSSGPFVYVDTSPISSPPLSLPSSSDRRGLVDPPPGLRGAHQGGGGGGHLLLRRWTPAVDVRLPLASCGPVGTDLAILTRGRGRRRRRRCEGGRRHRGRRRRPCGFPL